MRRDAGFAVEISMADCPGQLLVNGIPVLRNHDGHRIDATLPITEYMVPGTNSIAWELLLENGRLEPEARARATLRAGPATGQERHALVDVTHAGATFDAPPAPAVQTMFGPAAATTLAIDPKTDLALLMRRIDLTIAMPAWAWIRSPPIPDTPATVASLTAWYRHLHGLLARGQGAAVAALHAEKARELAIAYGLSEAAAMGEMGLPDMPADREWQLTTPDWSSLWLDTAAEGRLARLVHARNGPLIVYRDDSGLYQTFDFWVRAEQRQWIIAR